MRRALWLICLLSVGACDYLPSWMGGAEREIKRLPGERQDVLEPQEAIKADDGVKNVTFRLPDAVENAAWAQQSGQFTAASANLKGAGDLSVHQSAAAGGGAAFETSLVPLPVVADGRVYAMDGEGEISAHDVADISKKIWQSSALAHDGDEVMGGGLAAEGGKLYAASGRGRVVALDAATGAELWKREVGTPLRSAPRVAGGRVYAITIDSQLIVLDAATGSPLWAHRGISETAGLMNSVSPATVADMVLVPYPSGELYALKAESGADLWRSSLAQVNRTEATAVFSGIGGNPVVDGQVVFAVASSGLFSVLNLLNGQPVWEKRLASINTPWVVGDYVFVLAEDNQLVAMVKYDGRVRWSTPLSRFIDEKRKLRPIVWRGPVMVGGKLIVASSNGDMLGIDAATGNIEQTISVAGDIATPPVVAAGRLFLIGRDATLHSYQ